MKAKRWLVLAIGAMLVMNVSAREVKRFHGKGKPCMMEQRFVRCERCGKRIDLSKEARFRECRKEEFRRGEFRREEFRREHFRKGEPGRHHRHHRR